MGMPTDWFSRGFDRALSEMQVIEVAAGRARARLVVGEAVQNPMGALHGGAIATLVDDVGTLALMSADRDGRPGVSTDLNVTYLSPALGGSAVIIEARALKNGRTLGFVTVEIRREHDNILVAEGRMTKFMGT